MLLSGAIDESGRRFGVDVFEDPAAIGKGKCDPLLERWDKENPDKHRLSWITKKRTVAIEFYYK